MESIGTWYWYTGFAIFVVVAIIVDLLVLESKGAKKVSFREALTWSIVWVVLSFIFNALLWWYLDVNVGREVANEKAAEFFTGYLIEKSLAVDNIFVFLMLFTFFGVQPQFQRRVLILGIILAIVLRAIMILIGAWLIAKFHWILYVFGAFLLITGVKMLMMAEAEPDIEKNPILRFMRRHIPITNEYHGEKFSIIRDGKRWFTPLFAVMVMIGFTDVIFAVDSIPAIFAITLDPFIVLTSNVFAILGLRAMCFMLADMADRFHLLKYGLAFILVFIGIKMLLLDLYKIPIGFALSVVGIVLLASILASLWVTRPGAARAAPVKAEKVEKAEKMEKG
ncbi:MAG: TerC family protein [Betaproteobacteria bacterium]|nr:TerC family protein [Betaproteobacteria bacterium]